MDGHFSRRLRTTLRVPHGPVPGAAGAAPAGAAFALNLASLYQSPMSPLRFILTGLDFRVLLGVFEVAVTRPKGPKYAFPRR